MENVKIVLDDDITEMTEELQIFLEKLFLESAVTKTRTNTIVSKDAEKNIDGIRRVVFNYHSDTNGRLIVFESDKIKNPNLVKITIGHDLNIHDRSQNKMSQQVFELDSIIKHKGMNMLHEMATLMTEDTSTLYWNEYVKCWAIKGHKLWKGYWITPDNQEIHYISDYNVPWNTAIEKDQVVVNELFDSIIEVFDGEKQLEKWFGVCLSNITDKMEKEANEIAAK
jgi:hypothetical protein